MTSSSDAGADCPRCKGPLRLRRSGHLSAMVCSRCGGAWLSRDEITDMLRDDVLPAVDPGPLFARRRYASADLSRRDLPCPSCGRAMQTKSFEPGSILLDVCAAHGVWFDRHELEQVVQVEIARRGPEEVVRASAPRTRSAVPSSAPDYAAAERGSGTLFGPPLEGQLESGLLYALSQLLRLLS